MHHSVSSHSRCTLRFEPLEIRDTPSTAITRALELPDTTYVDRSGVTGDALAVLYSTRVGGLGNFPTGPDNEFVLLSTGNATKAFAPRGNYPADGHDWGLPGADGDQQYLKLIIPTPNNEGSVRFDINFMTDEVPGPTNEYNDQFVIMATPIGGPSDGFSQTVAELTVNDDTFLSYAPSNSIYARQTGCFTIDYAIPAGAVGVTLEFLLDDRPFTFNMPRAGRGDSALAIDNFRFLPRQTVWLNFDGGPFVDYPLENGTTNVTAFQPADIRSGADRTTLINSIVDKVEAMFAAYNINFTTTEPTTGSYSTVMIGGRARTDTITLHPDADPRLTEYYGTSMTIEEALGMNPFGLAETDYGNPDLDSPALVWSAQFAATR